MNTSRIVERKEIVLNDSLTKMVISGWGNDAFENTVVEKITYLSDGLKVRGYVAYPKDSSKKYPCIIWNRGGVGNHGAIDEFTARGIYGQLASWGYVVFASQYRGNAGGEGKEELGGKDVNDILNLVSLADEIPSADKTKWGIEGWSRGGMMTYIALTKTDKFKCAVLVGAISDLRQYINNNPEGLRNHKEYINEENLEEKIIQRSAINFADQLPNIPYLILHGGADETVSPSQSTRMAEKFNELHFNHKLVIIENGDHYLKQYKKKVDSIRKEWYSKYLL
ncbi:MAG: prolyl oligopeptidase family serine peptidase [Ignavibacteriaceae bacterium]|jgi:dipeptidyl aminopeptidase/acylaminoacyl peptidase